MPASMPAGASGVPDHLSKYVKMSKMLPEQAVVNKMLTGGYSEGQAQQLLKGDYNIGPPGGGAASARPAATPVSPQAAQAPAGRRGCQTTSPST